MKKFTSLFLVSLFPLITLTAPLIGATARKATTLAEVEAAAPADMASMLRLLPCSGAPEFARLVSISCLNPRYEYIASLAILSHPTKEVYENTARIDLPAPGKPLVIDNLAVKMKSFPPYFTREPSSTTPGTFKYTILKVREACIIANRVNRLIKCHVNREYRGDENKSVDTAPLVDTAVTRIVNHVKKNSSPGMLIGQCLTGFADYNADLLPVFEPEKQIITPHQAQSFLELWYLITIHTTRAAGIPDEAEIATKSCVRFMKTIGTRVIQKSPATDSPGSSASSATAGSSDEETTAGAGDARRKPKVSLSFIAPPEKDDSVCTVM